MAELIRGKVARILNEREIAINVGTLHGVDVGMYFDVIETAGLDVKDPDTDEVLGSIERAKIRVKIIHVQEKLAVATTYRSKRVKVGGIEDSFALAGVLSRSLMSSHWITQYETLKKTWKTSSDLSEQNGTVKVGDSVVQVLEVDEADKIDDSVGQVLEASKTEQAALTKNNEG